MKKSIKKGYYDDVEVLKQNFQRRNQQFELRKMKEDECESKEV